MIKGVIFDLDGTILNTLSDLKNAMNAMLRHFSYPEHEDTDYHRLAIGTGNRNYVKACLPKEVAQDEEKVNECLLKMRELYIESINVETRPYSGINELLTYLAMNDIRINVLSNKLNDLTKILVEAWFSSFPVTFAYGEREGVPRKPDPTAPKEIADKLGLLPSEMAFIGDSDVDIKTGLNAGMVTIGALWGYRTREDLIKAGGELLAESPVEVIDIIKKFNA